jgi:hypothetical protein
MTVINTGVFIVLFDFTTSKSPAQGKDREFRRTVDHEDVKNGRAKPE